MSCIVITQLQGQFMPVERLVGALLVGRLQLTRFIAGPEEE